MAPANNTLTEGISKSTVDLSTIKLALRALASERRAELEREIHALDEAANILEGTNGVPSVEHPAKASTILDYVTLVLREGGNPALRASEICARVRAAGRKVPYQSVYNVLLRFKNQVFLREGDLWRLKGGGAAAH